MEASRSGNSSAGPRRRLLYVDPFSAFGHNALNTVFLARLVEAGFEVDAAMREGYFDELVLPRAVKPLPIPERYFAPAGRLRSRFNQFRLLRFVRRHFVDGGYAYIMFSYFDEIALALSRIPGRLVLVAHSNVADLDHPVKGMFVRYLARRARLIVFHEAIKRRCAELGFHDVEVEPLGLHALSDLPVSERQAALSRIDERLALEAFDHVVFVPSGSKYGDTFMKAAISDPLLLTYLRDRRIVLAIRDASLESVCDNIVVVRRHLDAVEYGALLGASACVVLSYPASFVHRVSAMLFECFSVSKPCVVSDIPAFRIFERHFTYDPFFRDTRGLVASVDRALALSGRSAYRDLDSLQPTFRELVNDADAAGRK